MPANVEPVALVFLRAGDAAPEPRMGLYYRHRHVTARQQVGGRKPRGASADDYNM
jgi:hypothetical protein